MKELESEIDWERAERQDAQQASQRERKQTESRIKEAEDAASRAKAARRSGRLAFYPGFLLNFITSNNIKYDFM